MFDPVPLFTETVCKPKAEWTTKTDAIKKLIMTLPAQPLTPAPSGVWYTTPSCLLALSDPFHLLLADLRSTLISNTCSSLLTLAQHTTTHLRPLLTLLLPSLLNLLSQTIKVMQAYATAFLSHSHCHTPWHTDRKTLSLLLNAIATRPQKHARLHGVSVLITIIETHGCGGSVREIGEGVVKALQDQSQAVRMEARRAVATMAAREGVAVVRAAVLDKVSDRRILETVARMLTQENPMPPATASIINTSAGVAQAVTRLKKPVGKKKPASMSASHESTSKRAQQSAMSSSLPRPDKVPLPAPPQPVPAGPVTPPPRKSLTAVNVFAGLGGGAQSDFNLSVTPEVEKAALVQIQSVVRGVGLRKSLGGSKLGKAVEGGIVKEMSKRRMSVVGDKLPWEEEGVGGDVIEEKKIEVKMEAKKVTPKSSVAIEDKAEAKKVVLKSKPAATKAVATKPAATKAFAPKLAAPQPVAKPQTPPALRSTSSGPSLLLQHKQHLDVVFEILREEMNVIKAHEASPGDEGAYRAAVQECIDARREAFREFVKDAGLT